MRRTLVLSMTLGLIGCGVLPGEPEIDTSATCIAVLRFDGVTYGTIAPAHQGALVPSTEVGSVARSLGCNDTPEPGDPPAPTMRDGDSNFLPAGTKLHAVDGFSPAMRLAARPDTVWIFLAPL